MDQLGVGAALWNAVQLQLQPVLLYERENRMATVAEDAKLNTYTYDSDGFKQTPNVDGRLEMSAHSR